MTPKTLDVQPTPNPNAMKFTLEVPTTSGPPKTYRSAAEASEDPLARELFSIRGVAYVFMTANFLSVNKTPESDWDEILPLATRAIGKHYGVEV